MIVDLQPKYDSRRLLLVMIIDDDDYEKAKEE
jgi:hypothetical protein